MEQVQGELQARGQGGTGEGEGGGEQGGPGPGDQAQHAARSPQGLARHVPHARARARSARNSQQAKTEPQKS